jgi:hypothetical protein
MLTEFVIRDLIYSDLFQTGSMLLCSNYIAIFKTLWLHPERLAVLSYHFRIAQTRNPMPCML